MNEKRSCSCLICDLESALIQELCGAQNATSYRDFAAQSGILARFPDASGLMEFLRESAAAVDRTLAADEILGELLRLSNDGHRNIGFRLLLLALVPAVHKTTRTIAARFVSLGRDDIEQHVVSVLLEILRSEATRSRRSHFAFAITRSLRRHSFRWAIREASFAPGDEPTSLEEVHTSGNSDEGTEAGVELRKFLQRCLRDGLLTKAEHALLVAFKIAEMPAEELAAREGVSDGAFRHRMLRLVERLRRLAQPPKRKLPAKSAGAGLSASLGRRNFVA